MKNPFKKIKCAAQQANEGCPTGNGMNQETQANVANGLNQETQASNGQTKEGLEPSKAHIYNLIIVDESGSMGGLEQVTISGINETISTIRKAQDDFADKQQHFLTLVCFDERGGGVPPVRTHIDAKPILQVTDFSDYEPHGSTPLFDAMGQSLTRLYERIKDDENATALVTVITDGLENASREWTGEALRKLIERLKEEGWAFSYMGSCHDVLEVTMKLSIDHVMQFDHDDVGASNTWHRDSSSKQALFRRMCCEFDANHSREMKKAKRRAQASAYYANRVTPDWIEQLADNEIFVFGSNPDGSHTGGAAAFAVKNFGAIVGQGEGPQGQSYAIPTTGDFFLFAQAVQRFICYAVEHPDKRFLVTQVGCGNAGYDARRVTPLFVDAIRQENISLPEDFWRHLGLRMFKK